MIWTLSISYWMTLALAVVAAGFQSLGAIRSCAAPRVLVQHRFPSRKAGKRERRGVYWTKMIVLLMSLTIGFKANVPIQLP